MEQLDYTVESTKSVDDAIAAVEAKAREKGFGVLCVHDIKATLAGKGFDRAPLKIVEICNPRYAHEVLKADVKISLMLPCPVSVYSEGGKTYISAMRPKAMTTFYPKADIERIAGEVDRIIVDIVEGAK